MKARLSALPDQGVASTHPGLQKTRPSFWEVLARCIFLAHALSGLLRVYGALRQGTLLGSVGMTQSQLIFLIAQGALSALLNALAWGSLRFGRQKRPILLLLAFLFTTLSLWLERLLLWAPDQPAGNAPFVVALQALWLATLAILLATWRKRKEL